MTDETNESKDSEKNPFAGHHAPIGKAVDRLISPAGELLSDIDFAAFQSLVDSGQVMVGNGRSFATALMYNDGSNSISTIETREMSVPSLIALDNSTLAKEVDAFSETWARFSDALSDFLDTVEREKTTRLETEFQAHQESIDRLRNFLKKA